MIEKRLIRVLFKRFADKQENENLTDNSRLLNKILERTMVVWFVIGIFISYIAYWYDLSSSECWICNQLVDTFPSIDVAAAKSDFSEVMRIMWLYFTISTPIVCLSFLSSIPYWGKFANSQSGWWFIKVPVLFGVAVLIGIDFFFDGGPLINSYVDVWQSMFVHTIFGAFILCYSLFFMISFGIFMVFMSLITYFNR